MEQEKYKQYLDKLKKYGQYALVFLAIFLVVFAAVSYANRDLDPSPLKEANKINKALQKDIDSIKLIQKYLIEKQFEQEEKSDAIQYNIELFNRKIEETNNKLSKLQKSYNEKIGSIDRYTRTQLDSVFSDYYYKHRNE
jgi:peptidoglycan hydrolase CwlO-like protein